MGCSRRLPLFLIHLLLLDLVVAQPARLPFTDCFSGNADQKLEVSDVYAQILDHPSPDMSMKLALFGSVSQEIVGSENSSQRLCQSAESIFL